MRNEVHESCAEFVGSDEGLSLAEWEALPVATRVAQRLADIIVMLDMIREDLATEEARPLLWLKQPIDHVFAETDQVLQRITA